jgi:ParB-like chromosome segregation protein Spo0J
LVAVGQAASALQPNQQNESIHTKHQLRQIANSISAFGFTNPMLVDADNRIVAGHGLVEAAKLFGMKSVPAIRLSGLVRFRAKNRSIKK